MAYQFGSFFGQRYGPTDACKQSIEGNASVIHEVVLKGLEPGTQYFYRVESRTPAGTSYLSEPATFKTAVKRETPYAFAVISDTQGNPKVSKQIAELAWGQRPSFLLHPGDLVSTGKNRDHWLSISFRYASVDQSRPFLPVLGNHEQNAKHYYDYVSLPDPEYYYAFDFGNARFFMVDTNQKVDPDSLQFKWLERELSASKAKWKFVCHHHPPYSSDENDYGNLWKSNKEDTATCGSGVGPALRETRVDWFGTDTFIRMKGLGGYWGKAVESGGPFYMITGGGGGGLETPAPDKTLLSEQRPSRAPIVMVHANGERSN